MDDPASTPLIWILIVPFLLAWAVAMGSWFLAVAEMFAIYLLRDRLFERGPIALRREIDLPPPPSPPLHQRTQLDGTHVRFTSPTRAIFAPRFRFVSFDWRATLVKGVVCWLGPRAEVVVRYPLGAYAFLRAWLVMWWIGTAIAIAAALFAPVEHEAILVTVAVLGGAGGYAMLRMSVWQFRKGANAVADEVITYLRAANAPDPPRASADPGAHA